MRVNRGKDFEKQIQKAFEKVKNVYVLRLYDTMNGFKNIANPCDYIVYKYPILYLIECKSCYGASFPRADITDFQYKSLLIANKLTGIDAGYMIWFIDKDLTVFVTAKLLDEYFVSTGRKSLSYLDAEQIGVVISGKKKRVLFEYDLTDFFL